MSISSRPRAKKLNRSLSATTAACASALLLAACGGNAASSTSGGYEGVQAGASKEEYIAALADIDPIELTAQTASSAGRYQSVGIEAYAEAIEEWSDGKIKMNIQYSSSVAAPDEVDNALDDGRLDLAAFYPAYDPARYPAFDAWSRSDGRGVSDPFVGTMAWVLRTADSGLNTPELAEQAEAEGVHLMLPTVVTDPLGLGCTTDRSTMASAKGAQVRISGAAQTPQVEALGMTPVSMSFTEVYEGLQRGTVNCTVTTLGQGVQSGVLDVADEWVMGTEVGWAGAFTPIAFGQARWEELPLPAQQLLHDRLDVYMESQFREVFNAVASAATSIAESGGAIRQLDPEATRAVGEVTERTVEEVRAGTMVDDGNVLVQRSSEAADKWSAFLTEEAGYEPIPYDEFAAWHAQNREIDLTPVMDKVRAEVLGPHRPTN